MGDTLRRMERAGSGFELLAAMREAAAFRYQLRRSPRLPRTRMFSGMLFTTYKPNVARIELKFDTSFVRRIIGYKIDGKYVWFELTGILSGVVKRGEVVTSRRKVKDLTKRNRYLILRPLDGSSPRVFRKFTKPTEWYELTWNFVGETKL